MKRRTIGIGALTTLWAASRLLGESSDASNPDFTHLSLEELMNVEVTSVSRKAERLGGAAAAITVVTGDDLRRTGVMELPEAMRLVPGMEVGRLDSHTWAISARGFNDVFANKLLVQMDGRSVYTPLFSGVYWDVQDTLLEDIDRIEVIRGPGATLWGANAVNGVINILTRPAGETQGLLVTGGGGTEERGFGAVRYGGQLGEHAYYRVYGKYFDRDGQALADGSDARDDWTMGRGGFRADWDVTEENYLTLQGDLYGGRFHQTYFLPATNPPTFAVTNRVRVDTDGGNLLGRWSHAFSDRSDLKVQLYYDRTVRDAQVLRESRDTFDLDVQHHLVLGERQEVVWGAGYRVTADRLNNAYAITFNPDRRTLQLFSLFGQDEIALVPGRLQLTLGSKFEHTDSTGFEYQPSGRLSWTPNERQTVWGSVSRAVRTPSQSEQDIRLRQLSGIPGVHVLVQGDRGFDSEELLAYELGWRWRPADPVSLDLAVYYHDYDNLRSLEPAGPPSGIPLTRTLIVRNGLHGEAYGAEFGPRWQVMEGWRLQAAYTFLQMELHRDPGSADATSERAEGRNPHHQFSLRTSFDLPHHLELDGIVRYVEGLPDFSIPAYVTADVRLAWHPRKDLEIAIVGQNLLDDRHPEFQQVLLQSLRTEVERSVYGKVTWRY